MQRGPDTGPQVLYSSGLKRSPSVEWILRSSVLMVVEVQIQYSVCLTLNIANITCMDFATMRVAVLLPVGISVACNRHRQSYLISMDLISSNSSNPILMDHCFPTHLSTTLDPTP